MKSKNINPILCFLSLLTFMVSAITYVPPISTFVNLLISISTIISPLAALSVILLGLSDIIKHRSNILMNCLYIVLVVIPWLWLFVLTVVDTTHS